MIAEMMQWVTKNKLSMAEARGYRVPQLRIESRRTGGQLIRSLKNHHHFVNVSGIPVVLTVVHTTKTKRESQGDDRLTFEIQGEHRFCLLDLTQGFLLLLKVELKKDIVRKRQLNLQKYVHQKTKPNVHAGCIILYLHTRVEKS